MQASPPKSFFQELKRRKVIRAAMVYAFVAWLLVEIASVAFPQLLLPEWSVRLVIVMAIAGFPIVLVLAWAFDLTPDGIARDQGPVAQQVPTTDNLAANPNDEPVDTIRSIAVLPMENMSGDPENEYFSDGISEEILNLLAKVPNLRVASRTSSFSFRSKELDVRNIATQLGVGSVLEGSVRRVGKQVRITAQLIDAKNDDHLWSEVFDRELEDIFAVQREIAEKIVAAIEPEDCDTDCFSEAQGTDNVDAYDHYLKGLHELWIFSPRNWSQARRMFKQATNTDPEYGRAWAGLASADALLYFYHRSLDEYRDEATAASEKALSICPNQPETQSARGIVQMINKQYEEARTSFQKALELDPDNFASLYSYARLLLTSGELEAGAKMLERANQAKPDDFQSLFMASTIHRGLGNQCKMIELANQGIEIAEGRLREEPDNLRAMYLMATAYVDLGNEEKARKLIETVLDLEPDDGPTLYNVACTLTQLGEHERALDLLERIEMRKMSNKDWVRKDPDFAPIRNHPRFLAIMDSLPD